MITSWLQELLCLSNAGRRMDNAFIIRFAKWTATLAAVASIGILAAAMVRPRLEWFLAAASLAVFSIVQFRGMRRLRVQALNAVLSRHRE
ncbi:MAG TPA: hypothetical protein VM510_02475 [Caulifigura sp.]|nr:hypothetical protein [Caulifigura sp.]